jgi:hypothetical protein
MRRLLRAIARGEPISQDVSTLENPAILDQLRGAPATAPQVKSVRKPAAKKRVAKKTTAKKPRLKKIVRTAIAKKAAVKRKPRLKARPKSAKRRAKSGPSRKK